MIYCSAKSDKRIDGYVYIRVFGKERFGIGNHYEYDPQIVALPLLGIGEDGKNAGIRLNVSSHATRFEFYPIALWEVDANENSPSEMAFFLLMISKMFPKGRN